MKRKVYNKLVRDKIPEIIRSNKALPKVSLLSVEQFRVALKEKMLEEAKELLLAKTEEEVLDELADILQLLESIATNYKIKFSELKKRKNKKKETRGGFDKMIFLEYVDE